MFVTTYQYESCSIKQCLELIAKYNTEEGASIPLSAMSDDLFVW